MNGPQKDLHIPGFLCAERNGKGPAERRIERRGETADLLFSPEEFDRKIRHCAPVAGDTGGKHILLSFRQLQHLLIRPVHFPLCEDTDPDGPLLSFYGRFLRRIQMPFSVQVRLLRKSGSGEQAHPQHQSAKRNPVIPHPKTAPFL